MPEVHVSIDGRELTVPHTFTVLQAAESAGIEVPKLCAHPALAPIGACRICLVEVEKQRVLQPACTFPVSEGMVVHTNTPKVVNARRFVLELLFSERNHFCMYCEMSGSCELQSLAYEYGLDHWEYDRAFPKLAVDASRKYFVMDHNRCILCRRCVRACDDLVGNQTLGIKDRGAESMIVADMDVPFGDSSCVSCGTCLQVCPTGALFDRASAYMGATKEITRVKSRCMACSVGCGVEWIVRQNRPIRVEGDWDAKPNKGLLCEMGRFGPLHDRRQRVRTPLVRGAESLEEATWDQAAALVAGKLKTAGAKLSVVVSGFATNEAGEAIVKGLPGHHSLADGAAPDVAGTCVSTLEESDLFIVVQTDVAKLFPVASFAIKRGVRGRGARLIIVDDAETGLDGWAMRCYASKDAAKVIALASGAQNPTVVFGAPGAELAAQIAKGLPHSKCVAFAPAGNTLGLSAAGIVSGAPQAGSTCIYVVANEMVAPSPALRAALETAD
ncbi:MAG: 2Fe-2S iron-sulfur cluster binding domain-containing protein, partial [Chloroflexi bacterium]|nr:2Fe-2S iron-sulfur cluster binding domain-containing protein [Chloroflexota bacterium]